MKNTCIIHGIVEEGNTHIMNGIRICMIIDSFNVDGCQTPLKSAEDIENEKMVSDIIEEIFN